MKNSYDTKKLLDLISCLRSYCKYSGDCKNCSACYDTNELENLVVQYSDLQKKVKKLEKINRKYRGAFSNYIVELKENNQSLKDEITQLNETIGVLIESQKGV